MVTFMKNKGGVLPIGAFGRAINKEEFKTTPVIADQIYLDVNLPKFVQASLLVHEFKHLNDKSTNQIVREIKALLYQMVVPFAGIIYIAVVSIISRKRRRFIVKRFGGKGK